jgi:hypothetical protein
MAALRHKRPFDRLYRTHGGTSKRSNFMNNGRGLFPAKSRPPDFQIAKALIERCECADAERSESHDLDQRLRNEGGDTFADASLKP